MLLLINFAAQYANTKIKVVPKDHKLNLVFCIYSNYHNVFLKLLAKHNEEFLYKKYFEFKQK